MKFGDWSYYLLLRLSKSENKILKLVQKILSRSKKIFRSCKLCRVHKKYFDNHVGPISKIYEHSKSKSNSSIPPTQTTTNMTFSSVVKAIFSGTDEAHKHNRMVLAVQCAVGILVVVILVTMLSKWATSETKRYSSDIVRHVRTLTQSAAQYATHAGQDKNHLIALMHINYGLAYA
jgi:hypothetical protein